MSNVLITEAKKQLVKQIIYINQEKGDIYLQTLPLIYIL